MVATKFPAVNRISFGFSSILKAGGSGDSITAQEESFGKVPLGATRTRNTPSRNTVTRTFAAPAVNSTPSFSFSTRWTLPRCCQPCAAANPLPRAEVRNPIPMSRANPVISILPGREEKRRTIKCVSHLRRNDPAPPRRIKLRATVRKTPTPLRLRFGVSLHPARGSAPIRCHHKNQANREDTFRPPPARHRAGPREA